MSKANYFQDILERRISRRSMLQSTTAVTFSSIVASCTLEKTKNAKTPPQGFKEVPHGVDDTLTVPEGYDYKVLLSWGDPLFPDTEPFDFYNQTPEKQHKQFGFNNDFVGFVSLPLGSNNPDHGLLTVNHESTLAKLMMENAPKDHLLNQQQTDIDIAAHGLSIAEIKKVAGEWHVVVDSKYNRRITPTTEMSITGDAAGHTRMQSRFSPDGIKTFGTISNCAGGITPWGTVLTAEENIDYCFAGSLANHPEKENYSRMGFKSHARKSWANFDSRWDLEKDPQAAMHAGWIVEIDPYDPDSIPQKRTNIGRYKHEGCNVFINADNSVVAYSGDDQHFEYVYKFVSKHKYHPGETPESRKHNMKLLEEGTLYVAQFNDDGKLTWLPLIFGKASLNEKNGFYSQADICLNTRKAADLIGATPMDRPEDIEVNPVNGKVYLMLTNNSLRKANRLDKANPRAKNKSGQIIEFTAPNGDHTAGEFTWDMLLLAGKPDKHVTNYHKNTSKNGWLACPDNCAFDNLGNLWIATDGAESHGIADGLWLMPVEGENRGLSRRFLRVPKGAELCGPYFSPDNTTLFCAIQHPGGNSSVDNPDTRWPDFKSKVPPRPAVVAIFKKDGGIIGS